MYNVIADIAGQYDALQALLKKMPSNAIPLSIGDMVDRGHQSKEVVEFFMKNGAAILGNHEHMMLDACRGTGYYQYGIWEYNGGGETLLSFGGQIPEEVLTWVEHLPLYREWMGKDGERLLISHAFVHPHHADAKAATELTHSAYTWQGDHSIIWNRSYPVPRDEYTLQICGHNSQFGFRWFSDEKNPDKPPYAVCLDDSRRRKLTGIHIPTMEIFQQEF